MSRRHVPGAIACAAMSRMPRASGASRSACPMSSSRCRPGRRKGICAFYPEIMGIPAELRNGDGTVARAKVGKDQYLQFRETDRPAARLRRPSRADLHHGLLRSLPPAAAARPGLAGRQPIPVPLSRHHRSGDGRHLFTVEHEVRSATHPMYLRPLVNRDPGSDQPHLRQRPRPMALGDGTGPVRQTIGDGEGFPPEPGAHRAGKLGSPQIRDLHRQRNGRH